MSKVTLKKIADTLGISVATVSKALKDYPDIGSATKKKVQELAEALDYTPNPFAQSLRNQESKIIGLIIPEIVHHFFSSIINGVIDSASKNGYLVIVLQTKESYEHEKEKIQLLVDKNIDGILLSLSNDTIQYEHIRDLIKKEVPIVLYDRISKVVNCSKVIVNDKRAAFNATEYLVRTGSKKIAHIRGPLMPQTIIDRFIGYKKALEAYHIPFDKSLEYVSEELSYEDGYQLAGQMIDDHPDLDGIFVCTDLIATGVLARLKEMNIAVPDRVSVIGFSNWFLSKITSPSLTTVDQPGYLMGLEAANLLFKEIKAYKKGDKPEHEIIEIPTEIIARGSTPTVQSEVFNSLR